MRPELPKKPERKNSIQISFGYVFKYKSYPVPDKNDEITYVVTNVSGPSNSFQAAILEHDEQGLPYFLWEGTEYGCNIGNYVTTMSKEDMIEAYKRGWLKILKTPCSTDQIKHFAKNAKIPQKTIF